MSDRALVNAERQRDELAAKINKLNQDLEGTRRELAGVEKFIADWHKFADSGHAASDNPWNTPPVSRGSERAQGVAPPSWATPPQGGVAGGGFFLDPIPESLPKKNPPRALVGLTAKRILASVGKPLNRSELFAELANHGIRIQGKDPEMVLSTMMWRMPQDFVRLQGHGYWFKDRPWPPAGYVPGQEVPFGEEDAAVMHQAISSADDE